MQRQAIEDPGSTVLDGFLRLHVEIFTVDLTVILYSDVFLGQYFALYQYVSLDLDIYIYLHMFIYCIYVILQCVIQCDTMMIQ